MVSKYSQMYSDYYIIWYQNTCKIYLGFIWYRIGSYQYPICLFGSLQPYTFLNFGEMFIPICLLGPIRQFGTLEYIGMGNSKIWWIFLEFEFYRTKKILKSYLMYQRKIHTFWYTTYGIVYRKKSHRTATKIAICTIRGTEWTLNFGQIFTGKKT